MLVVIPVSEADAHLVEPVSTLIVKLGGCSLHDVLVVGSHESAPLAHNLAERLRPCFRSTATHLFTCTAKGWPLGPNAYFRSTVSHLFSGGLLNQAWYWFELDNTPLKQGWADILQTEYNLSKSLFMGVKHPTYYTDPDRKLVIKGYHMAGTGIYPPDFTNRCNLWRYEEGVAFDVWIQWEVLPHLTDTQLIQHNWQTGNYRREKDVIICDSLKDPHPEIIYNKPLREDAVVLHGCKDGSLAELILADLDKPALAVKAPEVSADPVVTPVLEEVPSQKPAVKVADRRRKKFKNTWEVAA